MRNLASIFAAAMLALGLTAPLFAQIEEGPGIYASNCFLGLADGDSAATLNNCDAQSLMNVESNTAGSAILKRKGFTKTADLSCSTCPVTGSHSFINSSGDRIDIVCQNRYCLKSTNGNAFANFLTAGASSATRWSWVNAGGAAYGGNNAYDPIAKYDGTTLSRPTGMPKGSILELNQDRLMVGDIQNNPNRVHRSSAGAVEQFTTGVNTEDSFFDDVGAPGDRVRGIKCANGVCYIFKTSSITACEESGQYDTRCAVISPNLGTTEPASITVAGSCLYFRAQDKNYWELCREGLRQISEKIPNLVKSQSGGLGGGESINLQTTQADWEAGLEIPTNSWDTATVPGSIFPSSSTLRDSTTTNFGLGSGTGAGVGPTSVVFAGVTSTYVWRYDADVLPTSDGWSEDGSAAESVSGGSLTVTTNGSLLRYWRDFVAGTGVNRSVVFRAKWQTPNSAETIRIGMFPSGVPSTAGGVWVDISTHNVRYGKSASGGGDTFVFTETLAPTYSTFTIILSTTGTGDVSFWRNGVFLASTTHAVTLDKAGFYNGGGLGACTLSLDFIHFSSGIPSPGTSDIPAISTFTSRIFDTSFSTPTLGPLTSTVTVPSSTAITYQVRSSTSPNNDLWGSYESVTPPARPTAYANRYVQYKLTLAHSGLVESPGITGIALQDATTGQFRTQCIQPNSALDAWGTLNCAETLAGAGSLVYHATSAASCATLPATAPIEWQTSVTNNATLSIATNTAVYIGWRSLLGSATDQAQVDACTLAWNEGTPVQPAWAVYDSIKDEVMWTTTIDNAASTNRLLKYRRPLSSWYVYNISAQAPIFINNNLYFGGASSGTWSKYGDVDSDNGNPITAYWQSKDIGSDKPLNEKDFQTLSVLARNRQTGALDIDYTYSNSDTGSFSMSLSTGAGIQYARGAFRLPSKSPKNFMSVRIGNESSVSFEVLGIVVSWFTRGWIVGGP